MPPHEGLVHLKEYDIKDSNVELIGTDIDHKVKYNSAASEPAWNDGKVGQQPGLLIWRIEDFQVVPWPQNKYGEFYNGDSYIVLYSYKVGKQGEEKLAYEIFFWLGSKTSQDEAGVAAYKTVELDEFLHGVATQHREVQESPSDAFLGLFPRLKILSGGVKSGFTHVDLDEAPQVKKMLLRVFKSRTSSLVVHEVEPSWQSLNDEDVFIYDQGDKIWVWQGKKCSPMEKAKAAQVVHDMTLAKHIDVEVVAQNEARSGIIVGLLGGDSGQTSGFTATRPIASSKGIDATGLNPSQRKLFRLSDASGELSFDLIKDGQPIQKSDFKSEDVFILDTGNAIWVWQGLGASSAEKAAWIKFAQAYIRFLQSHQNAYAYLLPVAKVVEGSENRSFTKAIAA
jgi:gelsolin